MIKRHIFSIFVLIVCILSWQIYVHKDAVVVPAMAQEDELEPAGGQASQQTPIKGEAIASLQQAKAWATSRGASEAFVGIANEYYKIGKVMGIRADVLYAQSAKETAFGNYTGSVVPAMNNFAGIKTNTATGDTTLDHANFDTSEEGVQAHFNHMAAYIGIQPVGKVHERYYIVASTSWAGTIECVEQLGGKWAPAEEYGMSIVQDYLIGMINFEV